MAQPRCVKNVRSEDSVVVVVVEEEEDVGNSLDVWDGVAVVVDDDDIITIQCGVDRFCGFVFISL